MSKIKGYIPSLKEDHANNSKNTSDKSKTSQETEPSNEVYKTLVSIKKSPKIIKMILVENILINLKNS